MEINEFKSVNEFTYEIDNEDTNDFGFSLVDNDEALGVRDVVLVDSFAFLVDPLHGNIKKININTGEKIGSIILDKNTNLRGIVYFNNNLYVVTDWDNVYVLNLDLGLVSKITIPMYRGKIKISDQKSNYFVLFIESDVKQLPNRNMEINIVKIDKLNQIERQTIILNYDEYLISPYNSSFNNVRGMKYSCEEDNKTHVLNNLYGNYNLRESVPSTSKYYDSKNIDFNKSNIIYFSVNTKEIKLKVYFY